MSLLVLKTSSKLSDLTSRFNDFLRWYEILNSELTVSKNCNPLLAEGIVQLERNAISNAQYLCSESLEINPVPVSISDVLENSICSALSLTGHEVKPDDIQAWHHLKKKDTAIVKLNVGSKNIASLSTGRTSVINQMFSPNKIFLAGSSFQTACITRTAIYLINVDIWKMLARFIPCGFGITMWMLNLMKEVNQWRLIMLLILKNFLELTI